jgi:hypothetical protein
LSGGADQDVVAGLARFKRIQHTSLWDDRRANAAGLKASLVGAAEAWLAAQDDSTLATIEATSKALKAAFAPVSAQLVLLSRLKALRQAPHEPVEAYAAEIASVCRRLDPNMPAREKAGYLVDDLLPVRKEHLLSTLPLVLDFTQLVAATRARQAAAAAAGPNQPTEDTGAAAVPELPSRGDAHALQRVVLKRLDSITDRDQGASRDEHTDAGRAYQDDRDRYDNNRNRREWRSDGSRHGSNCPNHDRREDREDRSRSDNPRNDHHFVRPRQHRRRP